MTTRRLAPPDVFRQLVKYFPTVAVNTVVQRPDGSMLFLKRLNNPAKGEWWVPGGRSLAGETISEAMMTILKQETGLSGELVAVSPEYFEEVWDTNDFTEEDWKRYGADVRVVHYVAMIGLVRVPQDVTVALDNQSGDFLWSKTLPSKNAYQKKYFEAIERMGYKLF